MLLDEFTDYLNEQFLDLPDVFKGGFPDTPDDAVTISEGPGGRPDYVLGQPVAKLENPRIQVLARSKNRKDARYWAEQVFQAMQLYNTQMDTARYVFITAVQSPFTVGRDENKRWIQAVNFDVKKTLSEEEGPS